MPSNKGSLPQVNDINGLTLPHLIAAVITAVIGGGVFTMAGDMAAAGANTGGVLIGWLVSGIGVFSLMMCFFALSRYKPELVGGIYSYARAGFGKYMGFLSAYGYWISALMANVSYTTLMFASLAYFFPIFGEGNNLESVIGASLVIWACYFLVCRGVKEAASVNILTTIAKMVPLFVAIVAIIFSMHFDPAIFFDNFWGEPDGPSLFDQVVGMVGVSVWIFLGIEGAVVISGRARFSKDVGRATIIAFVGILAIYLMVSILSMGVMPRAELAELSNPSMAGVLEHVVGPWGATLVNLGVALSLLGAMLGYTIISSECPHEAACQGVFPKAFAKKNKHGAPIVTLTITTLIVQLFLVLVLVSEQTYQFFYSVSVSMILIPYFFSTLFLLVCVMKKDGFEEVSQKKLTFYRIIAAVGFFYSAFLIYAGGMIGLMITTILFVPGIFLYVWGQKDRGEAILPDPVDKVVTALIFLFFVVSVYNIATGAIVVI
ncbi:MAG: basic amino acid/polyamine antiporter [Coriobacteriia bacterium]|nr:basic amino acid/polyamine antiporter [Coriobacteriia bacterium]